MTLTHFLIIAYSCIAIVLLIEMISLIKECLFVARDILQELRNINVARDILQELRNINKIESEFLKEYIDEDL